jgi:hypothetical protein
MKIKSQHGRHYFFCPGCQQVHAIDNTWKYNGDSEEPTITPSILVNGNAQYINPAVPRCHSFVTDGKIQFLDDCSHVLAGQTVYLPEWEKRMVSGND